MGKDWYQPDSRWRLWGITTREEYAATCVYEGRFHAGVHPDVVQVCETVSQLLAQAWYYYPLVDEAVTKLLFAIEMAVKLRCQQVGIALTFTTAGGTEREHRLQTLIEKLEQLEPAKQLKFQLDWARGLRNHFAHPTQFGYGGVAVKPAILPLLNLLNKLFLEEAVVIRDEEYLAQLRQQMQHQFGEGLLVLETEKYQRVVLRRAAPCRAHLVQGKWRAVWRFDFFIESGKATPAPLLVVLTDVLIEAGKFMGKDVATGMPVTLEAIPAGISQTLLQSSRQEDGGALSKDERQIRALSQEMDANQQEHELVYSWFWEEEPVR